MRLNVNRRRVSYFTIGHELMHLLQRPGLGVWGGRRPICGDWGWSSDPAATLQSREVERLTDFLFAKVIGQGPMDRAKCIDYWGSNVEVCLTFPQ